MQSLRAAVAELEAEEEDFIDPRELSALIDRQQAKLCRVLAAATRRGDHLLEGRTRNAWVRAVCRVSSSSAADRMCVGEQLEAMPQVAEAVRSGVIGYQSASVLCHFRDRLREDLRPNINVEWWIDQAKDASIKDLCWLEEQTRYGVDPDSFDRQVEEDYEQRFLKISESGGMFHISGVLDREAGSALEAAVEALAKRLGKDDTRVAKQRRADALTEIVYHAMDKGTLPKRHGVRPHVSVHTTPEALEGRLGAALSALGNGVPVSSKTAQRLACDGTLHRVLKADSLVVDVGRAHRTAQPAQWRALKARHRTCAFPGCDRPINWTYSHHVDFWEQGGQTNLGRMLPLCYFHHRLVHEGDWQVVLAGGRVEFIPPDRPVMIRRRWGERRWAA
jgi:hypothetical protein